MADENVQNQIEEFFFEFEDELEKVIKYLMTEYQSMRAGRANPHVLDKIYVNYYGTQTPINQMANISVQDARMLVINVWDISAVKDVVKAISASDIGITPNDDGKIIRLVFPTLTEDRRKEMTKTVKKLAEDAKVSCRNARRDCLDSIKNLKKNNLISEDMYGEFEEKVQKILNPATAKIDALEDDKEREIMRV